MKKVYDTPSVKITAVKTENIMTVSGFKTDKFTFGAENNVINF